MSFGGATLGSIEGKISINVAEAMTNIANLEQQVTGLNTVGGGALGGLTKSGQQVDSLTTRADAFGKKYKTAGLAMTGFGVATTAAFGFALGSASSFEQAMDGVGASLGGVGESGKITEEQFHALNAAALTIGKETAFSAQDAALAMDELAKAGQSTEQILQGSARASVDLASAIGVSIPDAAAATARAMNIWQEQNLTAAEAADTLTAAVNGSATDLPDLSAGLRNIGPLAASMGMSFSETAADVAFFTNYGLKGADAGVSLARALQNVADPSSEASAKMQELGIAAFDANGEFIGFPALMDQLNSSMAGMSDETKIAALNMIFGAEAADVMGVGILTGGEALKQLEADTVSAGQANEQARQRMDNFAGSMEQLKGSVETLAIVLGSKLIPLARPIVDFLTGMVNAITELPGPILAVVGAIVGLAGALAGVAGAMVLVGPTAVKFASEFKGLIGTLKNLPGLISKTSTALRSLALANPWILAIAAAIALLYLAYKTNFLGFGDGVRKVAAWISAAFKKIGAVIGKFVDMWKEASDPGELKIVSFIEELGDAFDRIFGTDISGYFDKVASAIQGVADWFSKLNSTAKQLRALGVDPLSAALQAFGAGLESIHTGIQPIDQILQTLGDAFRELSGAIQAFLNGDFGGGFDHLKNLLVDAGKLFLEFSTLIPRLLLEAFQAINWGALLDGARNLAGQLIDAMGDLAGALWDWVTGAVGGIDWGGLWNDVKDVTSTIIEKLGDLLKAIGDWVSDAVGGIQWGTVWSNITSQTEAIIGVLGDLGIAVGQWVVTAVKGISWDSVWSNITDQVSTITGKLGDLLTGIKNWFIAAVRGIPWGEVWSLIPNAVEAIKARLFGGGDEQRSAASSVHSGAGPRSNTAGNRVVPGQPAPPCGTGQHPEAGSDGRWICVDDAISQNSPARGGVSAMGIGGGAMSPASLGGGPAAFAAAGTAAGTSFVRAMLAAAGAGAGGGAGINASKDSASGLGAQHLAGVAERFQQTGTQAGQRLQQAIGDAMNRTNQLVGTGTSQMSQRLQAFAGQTGQAAQQTGQRFQTGIQQGLQRTQTSVNTIAGQMTTRLQQFATQAGTAGTSAGNNFQRGVTTGMNQAATAAQTGASRIIAAMRIPSQYSAGYSVGQSLGQGIAAGIASQVSAIANQAAAAVNNAETAARNAADARSPSRLFMRLGEDMGEGLAIGIERTSASVSDAFAGLVPTSTAGGFGALAAPGATGVGNTYLQQNFGLRAEDYVALLAKAEQGADFASGMMFEMAVNT